jgi:hypothetical protein
MVKIGAGAEAGNQRFSPDDDTGAFAAGFGQSSFCAVIRISQVGFC